MKILNAPTIRRMPSYLHWLLRLQRVGRHFVSTAELAKDMKIRWVVVRKDIALTGINGQRRVGYEVDSLINAIRSYLGWTTLHHATLIGAGALGTALLGFDEFIQFGLCIESVFDCDANKIGTIIRDREVIDVSKMASVFKKQPPDIALLCTSAATAQSVADQLVRLGVKAIWNFTNVALNVPANVVVQKEVIAGGYAMLSAKMCAAKDGETPDDEE